MRRSLLALTFIFYFCASYSPSTLFAQAPSITGELKKWHNIVLTFTGPQTNEDANPNPFSDYRMDVTFTHSSGNPVFVVPGYFAADGDAANTSAKAGNKWRVHFRPSRTGLWNYKASIKTGSNVAINGGGTSAATFDGVSGSISVTNTDKAAPDLRAKGRLVKSAGNHLQYAETGQYFIKFGPDSPESLLDYVDFDFDDTRDNCATKCDQHDWTPHAADYNVGDPTWKTDKGKNILGAINYLSEQAKVNSFSMSIYGGDNTNVFAWPKRAQEGRIDVSKLAQWAMVLEHAEHKGLLAHMKFAEAENSGKLSETEWKIFYREMIARIGHLLGSEFNISEEFGGVPGTGFGSIANGAAEAAKRGNYFKAVDAYGAHILLHTGPGGGKDIYDALINLDAKSIDGASMQDEDANNWAVVFADTKKLTTNSNAKGGNWVVSSDEQAPAGNGMFNSNAVSDNTVNQAARTDVLWGNIMAKGGGVMWYGGSKGDFQTENYRRYVNLDKWCRFAITDFFYRENIPFWEMSNQDNLVNPTANNRCFAKANSHYVVYLSAGGTASLNLAGQTGTYTVQWFDPRNGGPMQAGTVGTITGGGTRALGNAPNASTSDWAILVKNKDITTGWDETSLNNLFYISPNPSTSTFRVTCPEKSTITIFNMHGEQLEETICESTIEIGQALPSGMYLVRISNSKGNTIQKVAKQ